MQIISSHYFIQENYVPFGKFQVILEDGKYYFRSIDEKTGEPNSDKIGAYGTKEEARMAAIKVY